MKNGTLIFAINKNKASQDCREVEPEDIHNTLSFQVIETWKISKALRPTQYWANKTKAKGRAFSISTKLIKDN